MRMMKSRTVNKIVSTTNNRNNNNRNRREVENVVMRHVENPPPAQEEAPMPPPPPPRPIVLALPHQVARIRTHAIDDEPRTLLNGELSEARESALEVINTHTREEAMQIFLTGLQPAGTDRTVPSEDADAIAYSPPPVYDAYFYFDSDDESEVTDYDIEFEEEELSEDEEEIATEEANHDSVIAKANDGKAE